MIDKGTCVNYPEAHCIHKITPTTALTDKEIFFNLRKCASLRIRKLYNFFCEIQMGTMIHLRVS